MAVLYVFLGLLPLSIEYENLALHKPAYQLNPYPGLNVSQAGAAVDGLKDNTYNFGDHCVVSENGNKIALWRVDLTRISSIHHIEINYETGRRMWGPKNTFTQEFIGFSVYVSNTTEMTDGILCFRDTNFTVQTIPSFIYIPCIEHARFVIYYNERLEDHTNRGQSEYAFNDICEVEIYGCPDPGYYGFNCSKRCPGSNCSSCHIESGICQGCTPGYEGEECNLLVCEPGMCGINCTKDCGQSTEESKPEHVDKVCKDGYQHFNFRRSNDMDQSSDWKLTVAAAGGIIAMITLVFCIFILSLGFFINRARKKTRKNVISLSSKTKSNKYLSPWLPTPADRVEEYRDHEINEMYPMQTEQNDYNEDDDADGDNECSVMYTSQRCLP